MESPIAHVIRAAAKYLMQSLLALVAHSHPHPHPHPRPRQCDKQSCDPCHPNTAGYTVLAKTVLEALGV